MVFVFLFSIISISKSIHNDSHPSNHPHHSPNSFPKNSAPNHPSRPPRFLICGKGTTTLFYVGIKSYILGIKIAEYAL